MNPLGVGLKAGDGCKLSVEKCYKRRKLAVFAVWNTHVDKKITLIPNFFVAK